MGCSKYIFTPEMDEQIRRLYQERVRMGPTYDQRAGLPAIALAQARRTGIRRTMHTGPVKKLAKKFGIPRWRVSRRALHLGILPIQKKEAPWSDTELFILKKCAHRVPETIQRYLKRAGYHRTLMGIKLKKKRLNLSRTTMNGYTAGQLAKCFGVEVHGIMRWIRKGWLKAEGRGTARTPQQGGDEWFIRPEWVKDFIVNNVAVIDFRKLDKYWLVEVLTKVQGSEVHGSEVHGSKVQGSISINRDIGKQEVSSEVMDMFDEVQGLSTGSRSDEMI